MYIIGTNDLDFIDVEFDVLYYPEAHNFSDVVRRVKYDKQLESKIFMSNNYEKASKVLEEIKSRRDEIIFINDSIFGEILGDKLNIDELKIYELIPTLVEGENNQ